MLEYSAARDDPIADAFRDPPRHHLRPYLDAVRAQSFSSPSSRDVDLDDIPSTYSDYSNYSDNLVVPSIWWYCSGGGGGGGGGGTILKV